MGHNLCHSAKHIHLQDDLTTQDVTFENRVILTFNMSEFEFSSRNYYLVPKIEKLLDETFPGIQRPSLLDLEKGASLTLQYGHQFLGDGNRPVTPNHIYIGMMNCREPKPLPEDLKKFMDSGKDGVIYVSFGYDFVSFVLNHPSKCLILLDLYSKHLTCQSQKGSCYSMFSRN